MIDAIVIGGGITALSTCWELLQKELSVMLIHRPRKGASTPAAAGMLAPASEAETAEPELMKLAIASCKMYPKWIADIENKAKMKCSYNPNGTLLVALQRDHHSELSHLEHFQSQWGLRTKWLSRKELKQLEPNLGARHVGGLLCLDDHSINPRELQAALHQALLPSLHNRQISAEDDLRIAFETDGSCIGVLLNDNLLSSGLVVIADGSWSDELLGHSNAGIRPVKGQYLILEAMVDQPQLINRVIRTPDVYLVPRSNRRIYLGATMEEEGFDDHLTAGAMMDLLYHAWQVLPGIYEHKIHETGCGFRPALRDNQPKIGQHSEHSGLWLNIGHYRHGIMLAPAAAKKLTALILSA